METGYDDIDNLNKQVNQLYDQQLQQQQNIINTSTQQAIDELNRNKQKAEQEANKLNRGLYTDYKKQINPYGVNSENLASQGLNKSGLAESTRANYYNTYQNARAEAANNANTIKADFDAQIAQARQNGDIQSAQAALEMYKQRVNDLYNTYNLRYQRQQDDRTQSNWEKEYERALQQALWEQQYKQQQFDYNKERDVVSDNQWEQQFNYNKAVNDRNYDYQVNRDRVSDEQWQKQYDYNKAVNDRNYNYQLNRDAVEDSQWQKQYELSKKNSTVSSSRGSSSSGNRTLSVGDNNSINVDNTDNTNNTGNTTSGGAGSFGGGSGGGGFRGEDSNEITPQQIIQNAKFTQGTGKSKVIDGISGKTFNTMDELLAYYGYATVD